MESVRLSLSFPISVNGQTVTEIEVRRPKVKDVRRSEAANVSEFERGLLMISYLTDLSDVAVGEIDTVDLMKINEVVTGFTNATASPQIGGGSSPKSRTS